MLHFSDWPAGVLKEVVRKRRDFKLVVTSATRARINDLMKESGSTFLQLRLYSSLAHCIA